MTCTACTVCTFSRSLVGRCCQVESSGPILRVMSSPLTFYTRYFTTLWHCAHSFTEERRNFFLNWPMHLHLLLHYYTWNILHFTISLFSWCLFLYICCRVLPLSLSIWIKRFTRLTWFTFVLLKSVCLICNTWTQKALLNQSHWRGREIWQRMTMKCASLFERSHLDWPLSSVEHAWQRHAATNGLCPWANCWNAGKVAVGKEHTTASSRRWSSSKWSSVRVTVLRWRTHFSAW